MPDRTLSIFHKVPYISYALFGVCISVFFLGVSLAHAAYERYGTGDTAVVGEFVYDDDFVATTTPCTVSIYNPSGTLIVNAGSMTADANGWHYYNYSIPSSGPEGVWPTTMVCGSALGGDLVKQDKTFVVGATFVSTSTLATSIWTSASRTLTSMGTIVSDIWANTSRTLTSASLDSGSLAVQSDVATASSSLASVINANTNSQISSAVSTINSNTNATVLTASSSLLATIPTAVWSSAARSLTTFGSLAADVWANGTRTLTSGGGSLTASDVWTYATRNLTDATLTTGSLATAADVTTASSSIGSLIGTASSSLGSLVTAVKAKTDTIDWSNVTAVQSNVATLISEIGTGNISGIKTKTDTIAWGDITGLVSSTSAIRAKTDTISWTDVSAIKTKTDTISWSDVTGIKTQTDTILWTDIASLSTQISTASSSIGSLVLAVKAKTDTIDWSDITTVKNNVATLITEIGTGNISAIKTKTDTIVWSDISSLVTSSGQIKAKTDTIAWADVTAIKTNTDTINWADVTGIKTKTDTILWTDIASLSTQIGTASSSLASVINANTNSQISSAVSTINSNTNATVLTASSSIGSLIGTASSSLASAISAGTSAVNSNTNSAVLAASTSIGSMITTASSSLASVINALPASVWSYSARTLSSFGSLASDIWSNGTRTLTSETPQSSWNIIVSDFDSVNAGDDYLATVRTTYDGTLTDAQSVPTVTLYDSNRNAVVSGVSLTRISAGTYTYSYTTSGGSAAGTWEAVFSASLASGKTLSGSDYWTVVTTPAQVIINSMADTEIPEVSANITITNEGLTGNEYQYEWCIVSDVNNICGGNDDAFHAIAAKYINPGEDFNTTLAGTLSAPGEYYFKTVVYFGNDSSVSSRSFIATGTATPTNTGGGGGGGGGSSTAVVNALPGACEGGDLSCDAKTDSTDFSILLYFWKAKPPFNNKYVDLNKDGKVDSIDFSILLFRWTKK